MELFRINFTYTFCHLRHYKAMKKISSIVQWSSLPKSDYFYSQVFLRLAPSQKQQLFVGKLFGLELLRQLAVSSTFKRIISILCLVSLSLLFCCFHLKNIANGNTALFRESRFYLEVVDEMVSR
jgi:hypothetical protein